MTSALDSLSQAIQELAPTAAAVLDLPLDRIHPDPEQPRQNAQADRQSLEELAESFKATEGPLHPLHVEPHPEMEGHWQIVAGERRYHAAVLAGFTTIRAIPLQPLTAERRILLQLIENDQRKDLDLLSRAKAYERFLRVSNKKAKEAAHLLGTSPAAFSNTLRVLRASDLGKEALVANLLTNPETVRLFEALSTDRQQRLLDNAKRSHEPIARPTLERAVQEESERRFLAENGGPEPPPEAAAPASSNPSHPQEVSIAFPPLALRSLRKLFELLELPFPDDPGRVAEVLIEFLERER